MLKFYYPLCLLIEAVTPKKHTFCQDRASFWEKGRDLDEWQPNKACAFTVQ